MPHKMQSDSLLPASSRCGGPGLAICNPAVVCSATWSRQTRSQGVAAAGAGNSHAGCAIARIRTASSTAWLRRFTVRRPKANTWHAPNLPLPRAETPARMLQPISTSGVGARGYAESPSVDAAQHTPFAQAVLRAWEVTSQEGSTAADTRSVTCAAALDSMPTVLNSCRWQTVVKEGKKVWRA